MNKLAKFAFKLLDVMVLLIMIFGAPMTALAQDLGPSLQVNPSDYEPGDVAHVEGTGFFPDIYVLAAKGPDGTVANWGNVTANGNGVFTAESPALEATGNYEVRAYALGWDWEAEDSWEATPVTSASFSVTAPPPPTEVPTEEPTEEPTSTPTDEPTSEPTGTPTDEPTEEPTNTPTDEPTAEPTEEPTATSRPTNTPTDEPTEEPTSRPTHTPTDEPTAEPTEEPTATSRPTNTPTDEPTDEPTLEPTNSPTGEPTATPTSEPTATTEPTATSTAEPTATPTSEPTSTPSGSPTIVSDQVDYPPGGRVTLTGTNWQGDSEVRIIVNDDMGQTWRRDVTVIVAGDGTIYDSFNLPSHFVATYTVVATGKQTGRVATTTFADSLPAIGAKQHEGQLSPSGTYTSGNITTYQEGDTINFRFTLEANHGPSSGTMEVRFSGQETACLFFEPVFVLGAIEPLTGVGTTSVSVNSGPTASGDEWVVVLNVSWNGNFGPGAHSATDIARVNYTLTLSDEAGECTGSSQHSRLSGGTGVVAINGAQNVPVPANQIVELPEITVIKNIDRDGNGSFEDTADAGEYCFTLDGGSCAPTDSSGQVTFTNVTPNGAHTITETQLDFTQGTYNFVSGSGTNCTFSGNTATATVASGSTSTNATCIFNNGLTTGGITINKVALGGDATFSYTTNGAGLSNFNITTTSGSGNQSFTNLAPGAKTVTESALPAGWDFTSLSCSDPDNGTTTSGQTANIDLDSGESITCTFTNTKQQGHIIVAKETDPDGDSQVFDFTASYDGDGFSLSDGQSNDSGPLAAGSYSVSETVPNGWDLTSASCSDGSNPNSISLQPNETVTCTFTNTKQNPQLTLVKSATPGTYSAVGQIINYSYQVTNSGNVKLAGPVTVADDKATVTCPNVNAVGNLDSFLDSGESVTCSATYTITQADLNSGSVTNTATASAGGTNSNQDSETVTAVQTPSLLLSKTATPNTYGSVGDVINYSYVVTNNGNVRLAGPVTVTDDKATVTCPNVNTVGNGDGFLDPSESVTCTASYTITQGDLNAGSVTNTATASAGGTNSNEDSETVTAEQSPELTLVKSATPGTYDSVGDVISYSYVVSNTGNVALSGPVTVTDNKATVSCPNVNTVGNLDGFLDPGEAITCTASYTITQTDLNNGSVTNTATASAGGTDSNEDSETVIAVQTPALTLAKSAAPATYDSVGDVISYTYAVSNTGNVRLAGPVTVTDDKATVTCPNVNTVGNLDAFLDPGESITCTASYTITQSDLNAGSVTNTAQAQAGGTNSNTDTETVNALQTRELTLDKTASPLTYDALGDVINYSFVVINSGNVSLAGPVTITDDQSTDEACPNVNTVGNLDGFLDPGESITCTATYTISQGDLNAGSVTNVARAHADGTNSNTDTATVTADQSPELTLEKSATPTTYAAVGDVISYSYVLTNSGNVTLSGPFTVTDDKATVSCPNTATLAPSASITCSATYTITQSDLDAGSVTNTATGHAVFDGDPVDSNEDSETVTATQTAELTLDKSASPGTYASVGDTINYSYLLTNTGNVTLSGPFTVTDDKATVTCPAPTSLAPADSITCTAAYTITQADLDAGSVTNTATGHAFFDGDSLNSNEDSETVTATQSPALTLDKTATPMTYTSVGDVINYSYLLTNDGNVTLSGPFTVTDNKATVTCPSTSSLVPGASLACSATYTITQADLDAGAVTNTATGHATFDGNPVNSNQDSETVTATQTPELALDKTASPDTYDSVGDPISYSYLLTNTGNVTLSGPFTVTDDKATVTCPTTASLAPNASITCTATYTITQADLDAGSVTNTAQGHAMFDGDPVDSNEDTETVTATQVPELTLDKTASPATYDSVGDTISYTYQLTNTGNVTLSGPFTVTDDKATVTCPATASLAPSASITCTATYTITQADLDAGSVTNIATAHATFDGDPVDSNEDRETVTATQSPELSLEKSADPTIYDSVSDVIAYSYVLTNTGNVTLSGPFTITDDKTTVTCPATASLAPTASINCSATYTITQADLDAGSVTNTAQGKGSFNGNDVFSNETDATVTATQSPALSLDKTADPTTYDSVGDIISYSYELTNTGNVTLSGPFTVTDDKATVLCPPTLILAPTASIICSATYLITQADLDAGFVTNTAQGHASFNGNPVHSNEDIETVDATQSPALTLDKTATPDTYDTVGNVISYSYLLTNSGNVTLFGPFTVTDDKATVTCPITVSLAPGASITCTASYTITQADLDSGSVTNTAQAHATFNGDPVDSNQDDATVTADQSPSIDLAKSVTSNGPYDSVGDVIIYELVATNTGNVTLSNVTISDPLLGTLVCTPAQPATLAPNAILTCTGSYTVTQADLDAGQVNNTATARGTFNNNDYTDTDSQTVPMTQSPSLTVDKELTDNADEDGSGTVSLNDTLTYTITATNNGNVTLHNVTVSDSLTGDSTTCASVAPSTACVLTVTYVVTQADVDAGNIHNVGAADSDETPPAEDPHDVPVPQNPALLLEKTGTFDAGANGYADPGEVITYTFVVTNTGNVTLHNLTVSDPLPGLSAITCEADTIPVGESITCTAAYEVTQDDIDAGFVANLATADSEESEADTDDHTEELPQNHALTVDKSAAPETIPEPGGPVNFTVIIENTGNTTLSLTSLDDDIYGDIADSANPAINSTTCSVPQTIPVGDSYTCTFNADVTGEPNSYTDIVTATANGVSDFDDATVELTDVAPTISVDKSADPTSLSEPGGNVVFTVVVLNNSFELVTLTSLTDDIYGDLNGQGTCATGSTIAPNTSYTCSFIGAVNGEPGFYTDTVTAIAEDNDGTEATDDDTATVEVTDVAPSVTIVKSASPTTLPEPGGVFTFTLEITNDSVEEVTITALTDDNALSAECTALVGTTLAAEASTSCTYTVTHTDAGTYPNTAEVTVEDNEGNEASDEDSESVEVTDELPTVTLDKSVTPASLPEPGGVFTYTLTITNNSVETVTITALTDDNALSAECQALINTTLTAGTSTSCTYPVTHTDAGTYPNAASVTVEDNEGNEASDTDSGTVTVTDVAPTVTINKTVDDNEKPEPGGVFTYTLTITNNSVEEVTITALTDDNALSAQCTALIGTTLAAGASTSCTYTATFTDAGTYPNTAAVSVTDNEGNSASDSDDETVTVTDVAPTVLIDKAVDDNEKPEPGGVFTYTLTISNTSVETVEITALTDTHALSAQCQALVGTTLAAGASTSCTYAVTRTDAGTYPNTASVTVVDNEGTSASDSDVETVTVTDVLPNIDVEKYVSVDGGTTWVDADSPTGPFATQGDSVKFKFVVTNNSVEEVTIDSLTDSDFNLSGCNIPDTLAAGASFECIITTTATTGQHTNTATVVASDNDGNSDTDTDNANYFGMRRGQPSIAIRSLSISINPTRTSVTGQFNITDESEGANRPDGFLVALTSYGVRWETKTSSKNSMFQPVTPPAGCTYTIVSSDVQQAAGWTSGDPIIFDESVTIRYSCTFGATQLPRGGTLRGTAYAELFGRPGHVFTFSNTAAIPR